MNFYGFICVSLNPKPTQDWRLQWLTKPLF